MRNDDASVRDRRRSRPARNFGHTELPAEEAQALRRAVRLEWLTIGFLITAVTLIYIVMGSSQAMKAAWVEDLLSFIPPIAFLVAVRVARRRPDPAHPYGHHRSVGIGHLVAGTSLTLMGVYMVWDSGSGLLKGEHPGVGLQLIEGWEIWSGWLMVAALAYTAVPPVLLGRAKMKLAEQLHDRVLYADADMNKADWMTSVGGIVGVLGIGMGVWWADVAAALFISVSILNDGVRNLRHAVTALMDAQATTYDDSAPHPLQARIDEQLMRTDWVAEAGSRVRDEGHVFHVECFVVPRQDRMPSWEQLRLTRDALLALDWKLDDLVIIPVEHLPEQFLPSLAGEG